MQKKVRTHKSKKNLKAFFFNAISITLNAFFKTNLKPQYQNSFSQTFFVCFLFLALKCLETSVNCMWNCVTPIFTPLEVQFSEEFFFFKNIHLPHMKYETCSERYWGEESRIWKIRGLKNHNFAKSEWLQCILGKMGWQSLLNGQMDLNSNWGWS